jgi:hypothetical protein
VGANLLLYRLLGKDKMQMSRIKEKKQLKQEIVGSGKEIL